MAWAELCLHCYLLIRDHLRLIVPPSEPILIQLTLDSDGSGGVGANEVLALAPAFNSWSDPSTRYLRLVEKAFPRKGIR